MIQPIPTYYNGHKFRSRLEARWAVFFDYLNLPYRYEPEGYQEKAHNIFYLPDFWLYPSYLQQACEDRNAGIWLEIKPSWPPSPQECNKSITLLLGQEKAWPTCILGGDIWPSSYKGIIYIIDELSLPYRYKEYWYPPLSIESRKKVIGTSEYIHWHSSTKYWFFYADTMEELSIIGDIERGYEGYYTTFHYCSYCRIVALKRWLRPECPQCKRDMDYNAPILWEAYTAARSAQFEHGENPIHYFCSSCPNRKKSVPKAPDVSGVLPFRPRRRPPEQA